MHFEILVEDQSGKKALDILIPKILDNIEDTFRVISYKGIGHIPKGIKSTTKARHRILLDQLPRILKGYGKGYQNSSYPIAIIVVCDLDDKSLKHFLDELHLLLENCIPKPNTYFCIAIEEGEAWLLGDVKAVITAYPQAKQKILHSYKNDSICGTWELLADAVYKGGSSSLKKKGRQAIGIEKSIWAKKISPYINIEENKSHSFCYFRDVIRNLSRLQ